MTRPEGAAAEQALTAALADGAGARPGQVVAAGRASSGRLVELRALHEGEAVVDSASPYDTWGDDRVPVELTAGVVHRLAVDVDGVPSGVVSWHSAHYGPNASSLAWNIGIGLAPGATGAGVGSAAQRLLAAHLFATTPRDRVEASTDVGNIAEQRALERAGFTREGIARQAQGRADGRHDLVCFAVLRGEI